MIDLREKIKNIIEEETAKNHFSVLGENAIEIIQQIFNNYEVTNDLYQDLENIPKQAELVFVAAPTGAGKDSLVRRLNVLAPEKNYIELNMDIFRHYYSKFIPDSTKLKDKTFAKQTNEFAYEIYVTIQKILLTEFPGTNIIITGTLRETDWVEETFRRYKADKLTEYVIKLVSLAVSKKESAISVIKRYVAIVDTQIRTGNFRPGTARYTTLKYHDETFERFPSNLKYFEEMFRANPGELIDSMEVYRRSKIMDDYEEDTLEYSSERESDSSRTALETVLQIRDREPDISSDYILELLDMIGKNKIYMKEQGVLNEIVFDLGEILGYKRVIDEKLTKVSTEFKTDGDEPNI